MWRVPNQAIHTMHAMKLCHIEHVRFRAMATYEQCVFGSVIHAMQNKARDLQQSAGMIIAHGSLRPEGPVRGARFCY